MVAPTDNSVLEKGRAALTVELVYGASTVTSAFATSPMKLLTPHSRGPSVWAYTSSFGGGLVAGDQTRLELQVGPDAHCFLGTQAATKVYRNPARRLSGHQTRATLGENAILIFAPDPVQAFADSTYIQHQEFRLATGAGLAVVDWFTSGRAARGERWAFHQFQSRNEAFLNGERVFLDSLLLDQTQSSRVAEHLGRCNCVALLLLLGPPLQAAARRLLEDVAAQPVSRQAPLVCSASPVAAGALLRVAGESVEAVGQELHRHLNFAGELLGDDPWARKW